LSYFLPAAVGRWQAEKGQERAARKGRGRRENSSREGGTRHRDSLKRPPPMGKHHLMTDRFKEEGKAVGEGAEPFFDPETYIPRSCFDSSADVRDVEGGRRESSKAPVTYRFFIGNMPQRGGKISTSLERKEQDYAPKSRQSGEKRGGRSFQGVPLLLRKAVRRKDPSQAVSDKNGMFQRNGNRERSRYFSTRQSG